MGFPGGSVSKESICNAGDLSLIPGSGRTPGKGNGNPLQCSCLGNSKDRGAGRLQSMGHKDLDMTERARAHTHTHTHTLLGDNTRELQGNFNIKYTTLKTGALCLVHQLCIIKDMAPIIS